MGIKEKSNQNKIKKNTYTFDIIKIKKKQSSLKYIVKKMKMQTKDWESTDLDLSIYLPISVKELLNEIYKEVIQLNNLKQIHRFF